MKKLKPVIDGDWWLIGPNPDLRGLVPGAEEHRKKWEDGGRKGELNAPVDHHFVRDASGTYHLWGCVRSTVVGRVLYHWQSDDLTKSPWRDTREIIRCDAEKGECINDWGGQEWLQSPYLIIDDGTYYMFYGGHSTGRTERGEEISPDEDYRARVACQMCLMTSTDGRTWKRHVTEEGLSRLFAGPGEVRDPCVIKVGPEWLCYYAGFSNEDPSQPGFYVRTSKDLLNWSDYRMVHQDLELACGNWATECPHVVFREGYYYLFRTESYYEKRTHVFRSEDPFDFGIGDSSAKRVGPFPAAAVEIYRVDGQEYVTSSHDPMAGEYMARLQWVEDE